MQAQRSLTLHWRWFLGGSSDIVTSIFVQKGDQYYEYGCMPWHSPGSVNDARPKIIEAPLTLIFRMWQRYDCWPFCPYQRPVLPSLLNAVVQPSHYPRCKTRNRWRSVDKHSSHGATSMSPAVWHLKPANNSSLDWCDNATLWLLKRSDYNRGRCVEAPLTLRWRSIDAALPLHWHCIDVRLKDIPTVTQWAMILLHSNTVLIYSQ